MSGSAVLLAAHGAGDDSPANARLHSLADEVRRTLDDVEVVAGFQLGTPSYADALASISAVDITVVPVMTSDGYFRRVALPQTLRDQPPPSAKRIRITPALGTHPAVPALAADLIRQSARRHDFATAAATLIVVGHGTRRSATSSIATTQLAEALAAELQVIAAVPAFLDQEPLLEDVAAATRDTPVIVFPFLLGGGAHARLDIPERVGLNVDACAAPPVRLPVAGRDVLIVPPLGESPRLVALVCELAQSPAGAV